MNNNFYKYLQSMQEIQKSFNRALEPHQRYLEQINVLHSKFESIKFAKSLAPIWFNDDIINSWKHMNDSLSASLMVPQKNPYTSNQFAEIASRLNQIAASFVLVPEYQALHERVNQLAKNIPRITVDSFRLSHDFSNLFDDINIQDGYVEIDDDSLDTFNSLFHESEECEDTQISIPKRMTISDFLTIASIVIALLAMIQVSHYRKIDTQNAQLESQTESIERRLYEEEMLKIHQQQNANYENLYNRINDFLEYAEPYLEHQSSDFEHPQSEPELPESDSELPECEAESPESHFQIEESPDNTVVSGADADAPGEN